MKMTQIIYIGLLLALIAISIYLSGCAAMKDAKRYEMKPSPCACDKSLFIAIDNLA
ncbi:hypothetical protein [Helicobacter jaachi]|uniref:hypothetical protein n=1 Tax=Helicobacter jaachi TaxID=1677920 RepID=UPI000A88BF4F|nr:hypothetical protein [Helicobacter jaachi]